MYGGVSLAVYINGVATEFYQAVQGIGVYGLIKCLRQSEIVVDIISGASAGGVNGILLGCALAGDQRDLEQTTTLWRERGGIGDLLHRPGTGRPLSLFDGEGYYLPELEKCFEEMHDPSLRKADAPRELRSTTDAIDLFVTGTDYYGKTWRWQDALHSSIEVKDHRSVFQLKYRRGRGRDDFENATALAKLARITSSFPAALAPVRVTPALAEPNKKPATRSREQDRKKRRARNRAEQETRLTEWGQLAGSAPRHFIDGGVLDNKPFSDTVGQIYYRMAHRPVDRKLFFVEPDPDAVAPDETPAVEQDPPDILGVITRSLITLPRYESIAADLRQIEESNRRLRQRQLVLQAHDRARANGSDSLPSAVQEAIYQSCRWQWLSEVIEDAVIHAAGPGAAAANLVGLGLSPELDVELSLRRLFHVSYRLYDALYVNDGCLELTAATDDGKHADLEAAKAALAELNDHISLLKLIRWGVEHAFERRAEKVGEGVRTEVADLLGYLLEADAIRPALEVDRAGYQNCAPGEFRAVRALLGDRSEEIAEGEHVGRSNLQSVLVVIGQLGEGVLPIDGGGCGALAQARRDYDAFKILDVHLYPTELAAGIREKDEIETIRISACDAQLGFSDRPSDEKVSGDSLSHFGGFFKRTWRSNDIMWGRLDARCQLIRALLDPARLRVAVEGQRARDKIRTDLDAFLGAGDGKTSRAQRLFPHAGEDDRAAVDRWLDRLLSDTATDREAALSELERDSKLLGHIVTAAQGGVVRAGIDEVQKDAQAESKVWNAPDFAFPRDLEPDRLARDPAAFRKQYTVGEERLTTDVPPRVLVRLFAQASLILRDAIFDAADRRASRRSGILVRPLRYTRKVLGWPLQAAYWYATVSRLRSVRMALALAAALLFGVLVWFGRPVLGVTGDHGWQFRWLNVGVFAGFPAFVLVAELTLGGLAAHRKGRWLARLLLFLLRVAVLAAVLGVVVWGVLGGHYDPLAHWFLRLPAWQRIAFVVGPLLTLFILWIAAGRSVGWLVRQLRMTRR